MNAGTAGGWLRAWYFATPAFLLLDVFAGAPIRVAALPEGTPRLAYYALCAVCAVGIQAWPRRQAWIAMGESAFNLLLLLLSVLTPMYDVIDALLADGDAVVAYPVFGPVQAVNTLIAGGVLWLAFQRAAGTLPLSRVPGP